MIQVSESDRIVSARWRHFICKSRPQKYATFTIIIHIHTKIYSFTKTTDLNMKFACFALLVALLFVSARADDAEKLGLKCPVGSKFFKERIDAKKYEKLCLRTLMSWLRV